MNFGNSTATYDLALNPLAPYKELDCRPSGPEILVAKNSATENQRKKPQSDERPTAALNFSHCYSEQQNCHSASTGSQLEGHDSIDTECRF